MSECTVATSACSLPHKTYQNYTVAQFAASSQFTVGLINELPAATYNREMLKSFHNKYSVHEQYVATNVQKAGMGACGSNPRNATHCLGVRVSK